ncbi:HK97 gp10 family phage protein [Staphylococcus hominis]|uniref:HK97 gp10 family phage protein n=1 Tax=Staphylococcus hominis TaxID=1290 RepID=UPI000D1FCC1C|nr:HK97 gp10 family phage protein [Staphylococcus hominis]PTK22528.1 hypothetical protein BUZ52_04835 [Staphylococcus hominis]PTK25098.1 hypothetical protein BUZ54_07465 [Staphylococcus hominis]RIO53089.1 HK97 gp10 family phage protein [Staphylococcus hominis]
MAKVKYGNWNLVAELEDYREEMEDWVKEGIAKTTMKIYNKAVALAPVDTSWLRESISFEFYDNGFSSKINVGASYSIYVEYGSGIFAEGPGGSRAKHIPWRYQDANGQWHTTKGQHAQPFWNPAIDAGRAFFNKYFS